MAPVGRVTLSLARRLLMRALWLGYRMDITTIPCGSSTRERLAEYRDAGDYPNYDEALQDLLTEVDA